VSPLRAAVAAAGGDPARPIVIAHGTFQRDRGYEELLAATDSMSDLTIVFLGYGALERRFSEVAASDRWRGRLIVLPAVPPDALPSWLAGADLGACLIQPTTLNHRLSTPNKLFEAIAAGVPVLAADLPAIASIVGSTGAGVLVDPTDVGAIREALRGLLADPDRRAQLAAAAREAARTEFSWELESRRLVGLYDRLLEARA
jgi:glycosyltransferase involved in cell wall biosynthesis